MGNRSHRRQLNHSKERIMLKLDTEMKNQLQNDVAVDEKKIFNFRKHIESLYKSGNLTDLKKLLGVFYTPIVRFMFDDEIELDMQALNSYGFTTIDTEEAVEHLIRLAIVFYEEEDLKVYGDAKVTEALNYFILEDGEVVNGYFNSL